MSPPIALHLLGWGAAALTLATFICRDMLKLRVLALAANMAFIGYGLGAELWPVATLHLALVPVNLRRLVELRRAPPSARRRWVPRPRPARRTSPPRVRPVAQSLSAAAPAFGVPPTRTSPQSRSAPRVDHLNLA